MKNLKSYKKSFQEKYKQNHFSEKATQSKFDEHNLKIKEKVKGTSIKIFKNVV